MFTGIIEKVANVKSVRKIDDQSVITLNAQSLDLSLGESLAVNGVCLTVASIEADHQYDFYVSPETLSCTQLGNLEEHSLVNLERALLPTQRLSGHFVQGHVDTVGEIESIQKNQDSVILNVKFDPKWSKYCIQKGSITVNGTSLTINQVKDLDTHTSVEICLIPHTVENTTFQSANVGDKVNLEFDCLAKHMEKLWIVSKKQ